MEEKLNLILKVLALRLRLDHGFTNPLVENLVNEIDEEASRTGVRIEDSVRKNSPGERPDELSSLNHQFCPSKLTPSPKRGRPCKPK